MSSDEDISAETTVSVRESSEDFLMGFQATTILQVKDFAVMDRANKREDRRYQDNPVQRCAFRAAL